MDDEPEVPGTASAEQTEAAEAEEAGDDREPPPPIESRFLYVDVAAQRAKQLRRGALPRLETFAGDSEAGGSVKLRHKLERIAMREVDCRKIRYDVPDPAPASGE